MADSALELIRALKASSDPPSLNGPSKIQLAQDGWNNASLYMPNKAETVLEWLLTRLLKDKNKDVSTNPMADVRYWKLLNDILTSAFPPSSNTFSNPARIWMVPLLNRVPLAPMIVAFLNLCATNPESADRLHLTSLGLRSFSILWPLAAPKFTQDALLDCVGALLEYLSVLSCKPLLEGDEHRTALANFVLSISSSYRESLGNAAHKKKICSSFMQHHLRHWLTCVSLQSGDLQDDEVLSSIYDIGVDTIFNVDVLRVAYEQQAQTSLDSSLAGLMSQVPSIVLICLPRLFKSYIDISKKHRSALFGQGSKNIGITAAEQARAASMRFFATCDGLLRSTTNEEVWRTRLALLTIVDQEDLLSVSDDMSADVLRQIGELSIDSLSDAFQAGQSEMICVLLDTLSALSHIDYDLVPGALSRILPIISLVPNAMQSAIPYLGQLLSYHIKTRTVDTFTQAILTSFTKLPATTPTPQNTYQNASSSAVLNHRFLDQLSKAVHGFLTPGQVPDLTQSILRQLQSSLEDFEERASRTSKNDEGPRKKRKRERQSLSASDTDPDHAAVVFALMTSVAAVALTALPFNTVLEEVQQSVRSEIQEFYSKSVRGKLKKALKACLNDTSNVWGWQLVAISALRLRYYLINSSLVADNDTKTPSKLLSLLKLDDILPELRVEIYRTLLHEANVGRFAATTVFEDILQAIEKIGPTNKAAWTGELHRLSVDERSSDISVAGLHLLLDRWLPTLDTLVTPDQLKRLAELMLAVLPQESGSPSRRSQDALSLSSLFAKTLRNAQFWEMQNFRSAIVSLINEHTASMDNVQVQDILQQLLSGQQFGKGPNEEGSLQAVYDLLLYAPTEFLPRSVRTDLLKRALAADVTIGISVKGRDLQPEQQQRLITLREFMRRVFFHVGTVEHSAIQEYVIYLMDPPFSLTDDSSTFKHITLDLIEMHFRSLLSSAEKDKHAGIAKILESFIHSAAINAASNQSSSISSLREQSLVLLIDSIVDGYKLANFQEEVIQSLRNLWEHVFSLILSRMSALVSQETKETDLLSAGPVLNLWCRLLIFRRWLTIEGFSIPMFGQELARKFLSLKSDAAQDSSALPHSILAIALEELHTGKQHGEQLQFVVAIYLAFCVRSNSICRKDLDDCIISACKKLTVQDFSGVLNLVIDGLTKQGLEKTSLGDLIHLSGVLVHNAPEGTLKVTQEYVTRSLSLFVNVPLYTENTELANCALNFVAKYFNDRVCIRALRAELTYLLRLSACSDTVVASLFGLGTIRKLSSWVGCT
ncbi:unnamed protein product [Somion occarium]|uniref:Nucleolar 27S pre-rRNA processing Urb2/Npa2 C-terminal domain-containing protein n=1 Tax=Somion occarium TaxID=3059160 RepID=A0ABP1CLD0_9APHY